MSRSLRATPLAAVAAIVLACAPAAFAAGTAPAPPASRAGLTEAQKLAAQRADAFRIKRETIWIGARSQFREARERAELLRRARHGDRAALRGLRVRRVGGDEGPPADEPLPSGPQVALPDAASVPRPAGATAALAAPANYRCNDPSQDTQSSTAQSESSIAAVGNNVVATWNDGQGFNTVPYTDLLGFGWSTDGGVTWTDGGNPVHVAGFPAFRWTSDPVITVNEKTGVFWYCGLAAPDANTNAVAVARGRFTAGTFAFDSAFIVRQVPNASLFLDKEWIACDSLTGNLYVTTTTFGVSADTIDFQRSTDGGHTWSAPLALSANADAGNVQGSRIVVGPNGEVGVAWYAAQSTAQDAMKYRRSTNAGATFAAEVIPVTFYQQFGTGAPGFNRNRGINFPALAVDRTTGAHRGRTYLAWSEADAFLNVALPPASATSVIETEPNNSAGSATAFTVNQTLQGSLVTTNNTRDLDYWSFPLAAGQAIVLYATVSPYNTAWSARLFAPDGSQLLAYSGNTDSTATYPTYAYYTFTAPVTGTYFLRLAGNSWRSASYTVYTAYETHGTERGRDQRDAFVTWSDDGATWSGAARVNDEMAGYDDFLPELAVGPDGCPYAVWFDHRDDTYGSRANLYVTRSADGGGTWAANTIVTNAQSNFTTCPTNIAPNMGDYIAIGASATRLHPLWGDGRGPTSVDTWTAPLGASGWITLCPGDTAMTAPGTATRGWQLTNGNTLFAGTYGVTLTNTRNWPETAPATITIPANSTALYSADVAVPDTAANGTNTWCLTLRSPGGVVLGQCCQNVTVSNAALAVGPGGAEFSLSAGRPNPAFGSATIAFSLPQAGRATLAVFDLAGARVRTLVDGARPAGPNTLVWDGRDGRGDAVRAGAYFVRLEFEGRTLSRRLVLVR